MTNCLTTVAIRHVWCRMYVDKAYRTASFHACNTSSVIVHCIFVGCSSNNRKDTTIGFFRIPSIVDKQGEEAEELRRERRESQILAISRDDIQWKDVLKNERVCGRHFESGRLAAAWNRFNNDWVPTLNLSKTEYRKVNHEAVEARAARSKERQKRSLERLEYEAAVKRRVRC